MRQRVMIAMALSCNPKVLIADEPTTALDVTIQAQILDLMRELQDTFGTAIILITHDMGVVAENADRVVVMYAGRKVEEARADELFDHPGHPYTKGLLGSIPNLDAAAHSGARRARLNEIKGMVPSLAALPQGCTFAPRCAFATDDCRATYPPLVQHRPGHWVACWHADRLLGGAHVTSTARSADSTARCSRCAISRSIFRSTRACSRAPRVMSMRSTASRCTSTAARPLGLVGESGCGKSTVGRTLLKLLEPTSGTIRLAGEDITALDAAQMLPYRKRMQMIYQDPYASLNPRMSAGDIVGEPMLIHQVATERSAGSASAALFARVGLQPEHMDSFAHEFSGGQRQRIGIARALALSPELDRRRRAGVGAGCVDPGPDHQPAGRPAGRVQAVLSVRRPRPGGGGAHQPPRGRDVSRPHRRDHGQDQPVRDAAPPLHRGAALGRAGGEVRRERAASA